jgi:hypothetical protein
VTKKPRVTKDQAELAIVSRFAQAYSRHYGSELNTPIHRDKPDFAATDSDTGQVLGIEVTGVYQDAREAEINYWLEGDWGIISGNAEGLVAHINRALAEKAAKALAYEPIGPFILAIWVGSFIFNLKSDAEFLARSLAIPPNPYSLIALVITDDGSGETVLHILQEIPDWRLGAAQQLAEADPAGWAFGGA